MARSWMCFGAYGVKILSGGASGSCSSSLDAGSTKGFTPLDLTFCSEAFGLGAFYEETTRELDFRRAQVLARTPAEPEEPAEDTSGVIKMAVKFDR